MRISRISSTPINVYLNCPRKWWFDQREPIELNSEAIRFGSLFHGVMEIHATEGPEALADGIEEPIRNLEPGDYGSIEYLLEDEELAAWVTKIYHQVIASEEYDWLEEEFEVLGAEIDITPFNVDYNGEVARGRIDLLLRHRKTGILTVADFKTRANLKYAPFSQEDFEKNPQFAYYAAVYHRRHPEEEVIRVMHLNVLRENGRFVPYFADFDKTYLEKMDRYFNKHLIPEMQRYNEMEEAYMVEPDRAGCYKYGKRCRFFTKCGLHAHEVEGDPIETLFKRMKESTMQINSKDAPPEIQPVPIPEKQVSVLDGATASIVSKLQGAGLYRLQDLRELEEDLTFIKGIGPKTRDRIMNSLAHYYSEYVVD